MIQQPTRSTLFPYTTLFRSILETIENRTRGRHLEGLVRRKQPGFRIHARCHCGLERFWAADRSLRVARGAAVLRGAIDRDAHPKSVANSRHKRCGDDQ